MKTAASEAFRLAEKINWFPGHMYRGLVEIRENIQKVDLFLEVRDARIPYSSKNYEFDKIVQEFNKKRLILFNKFDMCDHKKTMAIMKDLSSVGIHSVSMTALMGENIAKIMKYAKERVDLKYNTVGYWLMIGGCPNVGKSSILNALRKKSHTLSKKDITTTSPLPCETKGVRGFKIFDHPVAWLFDTPGIMMPTITDDEMGLKMGLMGAIKDRIVGKDVLIDYMVWWLNKNNKLKYVRFYELSGPVPSGTQLLEHAMRKYCHTNVEVTHDLILRQFREGELGRFTLDEPEVLQADPTTFHFNAGGQNTNTTTDQKEEPMFKGEWEEVKRKAEKKRKQEQTKKH